MRVHEMNHVNLIGKISSNPKIVNLENGSKVAKFYLTTKETFLDAEGKTKANRNSHRITAWGKWVPVLEKLDVKGQSLAIEGRLRSHFFKQNGQNKSYSEIEINDMVIL